MRLLVCGDRYWTDKTSILSEIKRLSPSVVIEGEAPGADSIARECANELGIGVLSFPAEWELYGHAAGPIRNAQMLREGKPDMVLAFHDDLQKSKGTLDMVRQAGRMRVKVVLWSHKND